MQRSSCVSSSFLPLRSMGLELASDEDYRTTHSRYNSTGFNRKRSSYSWNVGSFETIPRNGIKNCPRRNNPHTMDKSPCPFSRYIVPRNVSIRPSAGHERKEREREPITGSQIVHVRYFFQYTGTSVRLWPEAILADNLAETIPQDV